MTLSDETILRFDVAIENPLGQQMVEVAALKEEVRRRLGWMGSYELKDRVSINYCAEGAMCQALTENGYKRGRLKVALIFEEGNEVAPITTEPTEPTSAAAPEPVLVVRPRPQAQQS